ncbi:protease FtsH subunit HflK [Rhodobacter aestuarii]|uniref:Protein HflK n=1 Tax=Rhodobacter aestuarii TaxID=453582 RepID=A0A1N7NRJ3_9RHOB|nr:FtsH protease activity modulator HflK [Rhodobacter aestuarii]PTV94598.1 protease FtsH subunit HflK [Rhodobacter aestuarii]SIT00869.1 protease FtsH subunit HflK [Rhodobacter aestuarii]
MTNGGPWGSGGGDDREPPRRPGPRRPQDSNNSIPEIDELMKKGSEGLRVLMGGRSGNGGRSGGGGGNGPAFTLGTLGIGALALLAVWAWSSFYTVQQNERSVELMFGKYNATGNPGLNFAPWPVVTAEVIPVTDERTTEIGTGRGGDMDSGLMLTGDQNIVDVNYQIVWNVSDPQKFLFNLADPEDTIRAVSESAMRDIIARSELAPILNRDRGVIAADLRTAVQGTLDSYQAGINIVRVNFNRADPPREVIDSFRDVQAAQQERDKLEKEADAYANKVTAEARGQAAQIAQQAEAYRAQVVNDAQGQAARFTSVYEEYRKAPDVTKRRMFYETMSQTLGGVNKVVIDGEAGTVPYLPLDRLRPTSTGGNN